MNLIKTTIVAITVFLFFDGNCKYCHSHSSHVESEKKETVPPMISVNTPEEFSKRILAFADVSDEKLIQLVNSAESSIALAAKWEQLYRSMLQRSNEDEGKRIVLDELATKPFLDLVKQKLGVDPPIHWTKTIQTATWNAPHLNRFSFGFNVMFILDLKPADRPSVTHKDQQCVVQQNDRTWLIPTENRLGDYAVVSIQNKVTYLAIYGNIPFLYHLYAFEENKMLWSSRVFAECDYMSRPSGMHLHFVEMVTTQEQVILFGVGNYSVYVEAFDAKTGDPICRFSTFNMRRRDDANGEHPQRPVIISSVFPMGVRLSENEASNVETD